MSVRPRADDRLEKAARRIASKVSVLLAVVDSEYGAVDEELAEGMRELLLDIAEEAAAIGGDADEDEA